MVRMALSVTNDVDIYTDAGARIVVSGSNTVRKVDIITGDDDDYDDISPESIVFDISINSGDELDLDSVLVSGINGETGIDLEKGEDDDDEDKEEGYTSYGAFVVFDPEDNGDVDIEYPTVQLLPQVFVTTPGTEIVSGGRVSDDSDGAAAYRVNEIAPGATRLASSITSLEAQNTILVGGPCVNTLSAELLGVSSTFPGCAAGFSEGQATLRLVEHANGNVALLVAGFSSTDTRRAARVLQNSESYDGLSGEEVTVSGTSFTNIRVNQPSAVAPAPAADDAAEEGSADAEAEQ